MCVLCPQVFDISLQFRIDVLAILPENVQLCFIIFVILGYLQIACLFILLNLLLLLCIDISEFLIFGIE
jgi:hypothetical protein